MLRVSPSMGQVLEMNTTLRHLLFLLEYCMVTGYDWWDVLLHVQPSMVHNLVEKLHEEYMRQNQALQQVTNHFTYCDSSAPFSSAAYFSWLWRTTAIKLFLRPKIIFNCLLFASNIITQRYVFMLWSHRPYVYCTCSASEEQGSCCRDTPG